MLKLSLLARVFAPVAAAAIADAPLPGSAAVDPAPGGEETPTREQLLSMLAAATAANEALARDRRSENAALAQPADVPPAPGCRRCAALEERLLELQAANEDRYRAAYDASGGPRLDANQPFGDPASHINLMKGL